MHPDPPYVAAHMYTIPLVQVKSEPPPPPLSRQFLQPNFAFALSNNQFTYATSLAMIATRYKNLYPEISSRQW